MELSIRKAVAGDLDRLMEIFDAARRFMTNTGNPGQWTDGYPCRELVAEDISAGHCYVCEHRGEKKIVGTFCFIPGPDSTYSYIEDGVWPDDNPYYVIHRLASDGSCRGIGNFCLAWCFSNHPCLRADTHADNKVMQNLLAKNGFVRCGIIYVRNGSPRVAYQKGE